MEGFSGYTETEEAGLQLQEVTTSGPAVEVPVAVATAMDTTAAKPAQIVEATFAPQQEIPTADFGPKPPSMGDSKYLLESQGFPVTPDEDTYNKIVNAAAESRALFGKEDKVTLLTRIADLKGEGRQAVGAFHSAAIVTPYGAILFSLPTISPTAYAENTPTKKGMASLENNPSPGEMEEIARSIYEIFTNPKYDSPQGQTKNRYEEFKEAFPEITLAFLPIDSNLPPTSGGENKLVSASDKLSVKEAFKTTLEPFKKKHAGNEVLH